MFFRWLQLVFFCGQFEKMSLILQNLAVIGVKICNLHYYGETGALTDTKFALLSVPVTHDHRLHNQGTSTGYWCPHDPLSLDTRWNTNVLVPPREWYRDLYFLNGMLLLSPVATCCGRGILDYPPSVSPSICPVWIGIFAAVKIISPPHLIPTSFVQANSDGGHLALRVCSFCFYILQDCFMIFTYFSGEILNAFMNNDSSKVFCI